MRRLALLHRWAGGLAGALLAMIGLTGAVLVWKDAWIGIPHAGDPVVLDSAALAAATSAALADAGGDLSRITFAGNGIGLHQAIRADGGGAYLSQAGEVVERWSSAWQRPELWLFELHHHLLIGKTGETVTGLLGLLGLFFAVSGIILWWRTRRSFAFRLWPARLTRGAIIRQHRDLGVVAAPMLLVSMLSGSIMTLAPVAERLLGPTPSAPPVAPASPAGAVAAIGPGLDWAAVFEAARRRFPEAEPRRLQLPGRLGGPLVLRLRQPFEWTPNGRTYLTIDPATARIERVVNAANAGTARSLEEKLYPVHAARVGGAAWKLAIGFGGLALAMLGGFAVYGFWSGPWPRRRGGASSSRQACRIERTAPDR
jgi:uncharacterized iron-regulated membrane protein